MDPPLVEGTKGQWEVSMDTHLVREGLGHSEALQGACWQVVAFRLPLAQYEALGSGDASPRYSRLYTYGFSIPYWCLWPKGFLGHEAGEDPGLSPGAASLCWRVGSHNRHSLQVSMRTSNVHGPLMTISSDDILEASLLKSMGEEHKTPPTPEKEATFWGEEVKLPKVPEISEDEEPVEQSTALSASSHSPMPQPHHLPPGKAKTSQQGMKSDPYSPGRWVSLYSQEHDRVPEWWREFQSLLHSKDECMNDIQAQGLAQQQAAAFRLPATDLKKGGLWTALPCLGLLRCRNYLPLRISRELRIIEWCGVKKQWHWPWPSRGVSFILECPWGCFVEHYTSSIGALPLWLTVATWSTSKC